MKLLNVANLWDIARVSLQSIKNTLVSTINFMGISNLVDCWAVTLS
jgi:hypothetical protein